MASNPLPFQIGDVARADFRTSRAADAENTRIQKLIGSLFRYQPARLAIGRSLGDASPPDAAEDVLGKPIRGDTLFGQDEADVAMWSSLILEHSARASLTRKELQELAAAHWQRGLSMLAAEWKPGASDAIDVFDRLLAARNQDVARTP